MTGTSKLEVGHFEANNVNDILALQDLLFADDTIAMTKEVLVNSLQCQRKNVIVANYENKFAGYAVLTNRPYRPWTGWDFLAVAPPSQNCGVGTSLLQFGFAISRRPFARLFVQPSNHPALTLYKKQGFITTGRRQKHYQNGEDAIIMMALKSFSWDQALKLKNYL